MRPPQLNPIWLPRILDTPERRSPANWFKELRFRPIRARSGHRIFRRGVRLVAAPRPGVARRLLGPFTDEDEFGVETSISDTHVRVAAPCGCVFPNEEGVSKALSLLANYDYPHARYYGSNTTQDFVVS